MHSLLSDTLPFLDIVFFSVEYFFHIFFLYNTKSIGAKEPQQKKNGKKCVFDLSIHPSIHSSNTQYSH